MTATDMHMMHRLGAPEVSRDGHWAVFTISDTDLDKNKRNDRLYLLDLTRPGAAPQPIAAAAKGHDAVFGPDNAIWFLMAVERPGPAVPHAASAALRCGSAISRATSAGSSSRRRAMKWSSGPTATCAAPTSIAPGLPDKPKTGSARVYDQLFIRHWDTWATPGVKSRLFGFAVAGGKLAGAGVPLTGNLVGDTPSKPFGGGEELNFSPDGKTLYFALREAGRIEPLSTNLDIFATPTDGSAPPVNLTDANDATDNLPTVSPDGRTLAYFAMARPGYEADRQVLMLRDLATGTVRPLTQSWDRSVGSIAWATDGRSLLVTAEDTLEQPVFRVDAATGQVTRLTGDGNFGNVHALPDGGAIATMNSIRAPDDLYRLDPRGRVTQLTNVNRDLLAQLDPVTFQKFSFTGANGDTVWGWELKPVMNRTLPIAFLVHGGPQGTFNDSWSFRWNPRVFSGPGYAVGRDRFPRVDGIRPGLHRRDPPELGRVAARGPAEGPRFRHRARSAARRRQRLRARRFLRRLYDELDRGELARPVQMHRPARRRVRRPRHGLRDRGIVVRRMGARRACLLRGPGGVREVEPGQLRGEVEDSAARYHVRERFPHSLHAGHRRLHRAPAPRHPVAAAGLPG